MNEAEVRLLMEPVELPDVSSLLNRPRWMARAACRGTGTATFFLDRGGDARPAKAICRECPVCCECLDYALLAEEPVVSGIWGGMSGEERQVMRRRTG